MSARILTALAASLLLSACATTPRYSSDRGGDYYYDRTAADIVIDGTSRHSGWGFSGGIGFGQGYGYGGYYSPWSWYGGYGGYGPGYAPWWWHQAPIVVRPPRDHRPPPRDVLRYSPRTNVRAERPMPTPRRGEFPAATRAIEAGPRLGREPSPPRTFQAPAPRVAPSRIGRAPENPAPIAVPRSAPRPVEMRTPSVAPRPAPVFRSAPVEPRAPVRQGSDRR